MWLLALTGTQNRWSNIGFLNNASRNYFWSHHAILPHRALSFRSCLLKPTLLQHTAVFQVMNYVLTWLCIAVNDLLSKTKINIYSSRSKRVPLYILKFCGSLIISLVAVISRIAPSKCGLSRCRPCFFIPHPTSILIFIPHPADPH